MFKIAVRRALNAEGCAVFVVSKWNSPIIFWPDIIVQFWHVLTEGDVMDS